MISSTRNEIIRASAGTGKTFELSNRYVRLLIDGVHPRSILATTFTRKAAGEILDRIVQRLASASLNEETAQRTGREIDRPGTTASQFAEILINLIDNLNSLQVQTLDAYFAQIARTFSLEIGLPPNWEIVDEGRMEGLQNRAIRQVLNYKNARTIINDLARGEAKRGVSQMVRETIRNLYATYRETHDQERDQAWYALKKIPELPGERVDELIEFLVAQLPQGDQKYVKAYSKEMANLTNRDWDAFLDGGIGAKVAENLARFNRTDMPPQIFGPLRELAENAVAPKINAMVAQTQAAHKFLADFHGQLMRLKYENAAMRFEDVSYLAHLLLRRYSPNGLAYRMDQRIDHLLLDEFQDTSIEQWQILKPIAKHTCSPSKRRSFFCVGDIKQAIFNFRGGVAEIFEEVETELAGSLDEVSAINKSWRSAPPIIQIVNQIFKNAANSKSLREKKSAYRSWVEQFDEHETEQTNLAGYASVETTPDSEQHYRHVAQRIKEIHLAAPHKSMGVLVRTNDILARIIFELGRVGIAASEEGGNPLTDSAAVNLMLSALRLIDHPDDRVSRFHILHSPLAAEFALSEENWNENAREPRRAAQELRRELLDSGYGELIKRLADQLDEHCTRREWFRLGQLIEQGFRVSVADNLRTLDFVNWVEHESVADPSAAPIKVITIHKSKGLEFDIVVLPNLDYDLGRTPNYIVGRESPTKPIDLVCRYMSQAKREWLPGEFQDAFKQSQQARVHEMLSTTYVALTRARQAMHILLPPNSHRGLQKASGMILESLDITHDVQNSAAAKLLWQTGDPNWYRAEGSDVEHAQPPTRQPAIQEINFAPSSRPRSLPWESPSAREGGDTVRLGRLLRLENNRDARMLGSLIHACFEQVIWIEDGLPADEALRTRLSTVEGADEKSIVKAIGSFKKMIAKPITGSLLSRQQYQGDLFNSYEKTAVQNERSFAVRMDNAILAGYIDRLVLLYRENKIVSADIVDFKTDQLKSSDAEAIALRTDVYRPQIKSYRDAVAQLFGLARQDVTARLIYVAIDHEAVLA